MVILFDGVCNLCSGAVQFILPRDHRELFNFASLQSDFGRKIQIENQLDPVALDSILLMKSDGRLLSKSDAVLEIARNLGGGWQFFTVFKVLPKPLRDWLYDFVARNRYRWFGKKEACWLPRPEWKRRFFS